MKKLISSVLVCGAVLFAGNVSSGSSIEEQNIGYEMDAHKNLLIAAKAGDVDAQTIIGEMYLDGIGVDVDHQEAFYWLSKAAHSEDKDAQYLLGFMYENGLKVDQNEKRAVKWYTEAAMQGDLLSQYNLAIIYKEGKGSIKKDMTKAFKWLHMVEDTRSKMKYVASK
jgi:TPR repeat protein